MRIRTLISTLMTACGIGFSGGAVAADLFVIANNPQRMTAAELREVFLGERQFAAGQRLTPIDNGSLQREFLTRVVGVEPSKYVSVWAKKGFREGLNPPDLLATDQDVIAAVRATPGAVGYVSRLSQGVHLVEKY